MPRQHGPPPERRPEPHPQPAGHGARTARRRRRPHPTMATAHDGRPVAHNVAMRHRSSITSLSWIPSEAVEGSTRLAFEAVLAHYDEPPPEVLEDVQELCAEDRFRFANILDAWIEVDDAGAIVAG